MEQRAIKIMSLLVDFNRPVPLHYLMQRFSVTDRTIRYDLQRIDAWLAELALPALIRGSHGIAYKADEETKMQTRKQLKELSEDRNILTLDQRRRLIALELLFGADFTTFDYLAEKFDVSRSTIVNDVSDIRQSISGQVKIAGYPRKGIRAEGSELDIRHTFIQLLLEMVSLNEMVDYLFLESGRPTCVSINQQVIFSWEQLEECAKIAHQLSDNLGTIWTDRSILMITYAMLVSLLRSSLGYTFDEPLPESVADTRDYAVVHSVIKTPKNTYFQSLSADDIKFISIYVLCANTCNISYYKKENDIQLQLAADTILKGLQPQLGSQFIIYDELLEELSEYLSHSYYRVRFHLPLCSFTKTTTYDDALYNKIEKIIPIYSHDFEKLVGESIPAAEFRGMATLVYELYRLQTTGVGSYKVALVTSSDEFSCYRYIFNLQKEYPQIDVMAILTRHQVAQHDLSKSLDFILTDRPLATETTQQFVIQDLTDKAQTASMREFLAQNPPRFSSAGGNTRMVMQNVLKAASSVCTSEQYDLFVQALTERVGPVEYNYFQGDTPIMLKDMLKEENIRFNVPVDDWQEAVRACGQLLLEGGYVKPSYIDAMIEISQENGPYIVIAPGIALPHARPEDGVKKIGMSLITLQDPIRFGHEDNDPVSLVICFSTPDKSSHLEALAELFEILSDDAKREQLLHANALSDVLSLL